MKIFNYGNDYAYQLKQKKEAASLSEKKTVDVVEVKNSNLISDAGNEIQTRGEGIVDVPTDDTEPQKKRRKKKKEEGAEEVEL